VAIDDIPRPWIVPTAELGFVNELAAVLYLLFDSSHPLTSWSHWICLSPSDPCAHALFHLGVLLGNLRPLELVVDLFVPLLALI
jgi:hypothetical protein